jgi:glutathione peroxidase
MQKVNLSLLIFVPLLLCSCKPAEKPHDSNNESPAAMPHGRLYSFTMDDIAGQPMTLSQYKGKVLLIVNVASKCGYTKQYAGLQELYMKYKDRGFIVLGFPANNFGGQEPGSNPEIKEFCSIKFSVTFPMFSKISVKDEDIHPLYRYLTSATENAPFGGPIEWNFTKFLIGKDGKTISRFPSATTPLDTKVIEAIERGLDAAVY